MSDQSLDLAFEPFQKIARFARDIMVTEKIDGSNAQIAIQKIADHVRPLHAATTLTSYGQNYALYAGSRSRWLRAEKGFDNFGFAAWALDHAEALIDGLGEGRHFGEWWGSGINRGYGLDHKRFSLFNVDRWASVALPQGVFTVPVLYRGLFRTDAVEAALARLRSGGSLAAPGFMQPEGVVVFHVAANAGFKVTLERDEERKGKP